MSVIYLRSNAVAPDPRVEKEVNSLLKSGNKVTILAWDRSGSTPKNGQIALPAGSCTIYRYQGRAGFGHGLRTLPVLLKFQFFLLAKLFKFRNDYKIIHAADFDTILPALFMKLILRKKVIYDVYDFYVDAFSVPKILRGFIKKIDLFSMGVVDGVIITNESRFEQISGSSPQRICVIHNTPDVSYNINYQVMTSNKDEFKINVAYVGILQPNRLLEEILEVFARNPSWKLDIAGFGVLEDLVVSYAGKNPNIIFHGRISYDDAIRVNSNADLLFATYDPNVPNHRFSSPNKLYEAMLLSKPIIVCNSTGIDALVNDEGIGFSIDYSGVSFECCLKNIQDSKVDLSSMGNKSRSLYEEKYSWSKMESILNDFYKSVLYSK
ncbi:glycosyltransferase family 4 protein [Vibrio cholerae]|uniref:glycosyltransferase family 4 protein n=1 Tax=Vibrio cholerae TaxID=666 RepID=UPI00115C178D|nr:glycosyltransferase family 4 protein [Vibrio cholerae]TQQ62577.1 glycosyltransferase family 4 protein [Vibrio cholerae]